MAMDAAHATLASCRLRDCKGPGVDLSGAARATITGGRIEACVGGVWAWDAARAALAAGACVAGGPSHALLADGEAALEVRVRPAGRWGRDPARPRPQKARPALHPPTNLSTTRSPPTHPPPPLPGLDHPGQRARHGGGLGRHPARLQRPGAARRPHRLPARGGALPLGAQPVRPQVASERRRRQGCGGPRNAASV